MEKILRVLLSFTAVCIAAFLIVDGFVFYKNTNALSLLESAPDSVAEMADWLELLGGGGEITDEALGELLQGYGEEFLAELIGEGDFLGSLLQGSKELLLDDLLKQAMDMSDLEEALGETIAEPYDNQSGEMEEEQTEVQTNAAIKLVQNGTPVVFEDTEMETCVKNMLGLDSGSTVTEEACEEIRKLDCRKYKLKTLADLQYFPNLEKLWVSNGGDGLHLKGINKVPKLKELILKNCGLSELDRLAELNQLEYLDISVDDGYSIYVKDYSYLSGLTKLRYLNMRYPYFDPIRIENGSFINNMSELEELDLYGVNLQNSSFSKLSNLKRLTISAMDLEEVFKGMVESGAMSKLEYLDAEREELTNEAMINGLSKASSLKELRIGFASQLTTLEGFSNLKNLKKLDVDNNNAFGLTLSSYDEICKLINLEELIFQEKLNMKKEGDIGKEPDDYKCLSQLKNLKKLSVKVYDDMSFQCFKELKALEYLSVDAFSTLHTTEIDLSGIEELTSLKELWYRGVCFKSTAPLDELENLTLQEFYMTSKPSWWEET